VAAREFGKGLEKNAAAAFGPGVLMQTGLAEVVFYHDMSGLYTEAPFALRAKLESAPVDDGDDDGGDDANGGGLADGHRP
jgi:hypothetical protein